MSDLLLAFSNSLTALALCIVVGFVCRRKFILTDVHTSGLAELLVKVAMPSTVFISLMRPFSNELMIESLLTFFITGFIYIIGGYVGLIVSKLMKATNGERECWQFGIAFGNVGFMGIPVVMAVFGEAGLIYVSMAAASFSLLSFTLGVRMFDKAPKGIHILGLLKNSPAIPATAVGFLFFLTGLRLPSPLEGGIEIISGMTTPLSMILIGAILAKQKLKESLTDLRVLPPTFVKLVFVPLAVFFVLQFFIENRLMLSVIVTLMAMPPAAATAIFAERYEGDAVAAAKFVVVPTILCVVTVPLIAILF